MVRDYPKKVFTRLFTSKAIKRKTIKAMVSEGRPLLLNEEQVLQLNAMHVGSHASACTT